MSEDIIPVWGSGVHRRGASLIEYARGAGGRVDLLPGRYLDMIAEAVVYAHPRYVCWTTCELLISGRYVRSRHPKLRSLTIAELRADNAARNRRHYLRRRENPEFVEAERARARAKLARQRKTVL